MALTYLNLQDLVLNVLDVDDTSTRDDVKKYINMVGKEIWHRFAWPERVTAAFANTGATYSTGTVSITKNSDALTGAGTDWAAGGISTDYKFALALNKPWFQLDGVSSGTSASLAEVYPFTTLSGSAYVMYQDTLTLANNVEKILGIWIHDDENSYKLVRVPDNLLDSIGHYPDRSDRPCAYTIIERAGDSQPTIRFDVATDQVYRVEYKYLKSYTDMSADGDDCDVPESRRNLILTGALAYAYERDHAAKARVKRAEFEAGLEDAWRREGSTQAGIVGALSSRRFPMSGRFPYSSDVTWT